MSSGAFYKASRVPPTHLIAVLLLMITLPPFIYYVWICIDEFGGTLQNPTIIMFYRIPRPTISSTLLYGFWLLLQVALQIIAPGKLRKAFRTLMAAASDTR